MTSENHVIEWNHIKYTPLLVENHIDGINKDRTLVTINGYTIPISNRGIELEWWESRRDTSDDEMKLPIPEYLRKYIHLKEIHYMTAASLQHIFPKHTYDNMVYPQIYDWLKRRNMEMNQVDLSQGGDVIMPVVEDVGVEAFMSGGSLIEGQGRLNNLENLIADINKRGDLTTVEKGDLITYIQNKTPEEIIALLEEDYKELWEEVEESLAPGHTGTTESELRSIFNAHQQFLTSLANQLPTETRVELSSKGLPLLLWNTILGKEVPGDKPETSVIEDCINKMMMTEHNDEEYIQRIRLYNNISELGNPRNREDLLYIQSKIIRFITLEPSVINDCLDIVYVVPDDLCSSGLSGDPMKILGNFLNMNTNMDDKTQTKYIRVVSDKLVKYVPDIIKKIIDISEQYEKDKCNDVVHPNTLMLKNIYENIFVKNNMMSMELPDLGISNFFIDFRQNILTKVILLAFIAFVFSKLLSLFNIQYNIKS